MSERREIPRRKFMQVAGTIAAAGALVGADTADVKPFFKEISRIKLNIQNPGALAVGADGTLYVAGENIVVVMDADGKEKNKISIKGAAGCAFASPAGKILLGLRDCVLVMDSKGAVSAEWPSLGERAYLTSITGDDDNVYVADAGNRSVMRLSYEGRLLNRIGDKDKARDIPGFIVPSPYFDVAIDPQGALWAVNPGRHGLENYRPNGDLVSSWYRPGMELAAFCGCCNPIHVAFRSNSTLVTAEKGINRIKVYAPDNSLAAVVVAPSTVDEKALNCSAEAPIKDLAIDAKDRILVLDKSENAIVIYDEVAKTK